MSLMNPPSSATAKPFLSTPPTIGVNSKVLSALNFPSPFFLKSNLKPSVSFSPKIRLPLGVTKLSSVSTMSGEPVMFSEALIDMNESSSFYVFAYSKFLFKNLNLYSTLPSLLISFGCGNF